MKIGLIGYGKMGKAIERLAVERGHEVVAKVDLKSGDDLKLLRSIEVDVVIEFSSPESAFSVITKTLELGIPVLSGTTGWLDKLPVIEKIVKESGGTFLHSSNFSIGVNLFFELTEWLSSKMVGKGFKLELEEIHHTEKLDAPSGTAIRLAQGIIVNDSHKNGWLNDHTTDQTKVPIISKREPNVPGTHTVEYSTEMEQIEIKHTAHSRDVFALGVVDVAEWIHNKSGFLTMKDFLNKSE